jgi:hypothetical protein
MQIAGYNCRPTGLMDWCMSTADVPRAVTCIRFCKHQNSVLIGSGDGSIAVSIRTTAAVPVLCIVGDVLSLLASGLLLSAGYRHSRLS